MIARNDITGAQIRTKNNSSAYRDNFDAVFGKKTDVPQGLDREELRTLIIDSAEPILQDRYQGALLGLAVGDAIGTTVEFLYRDEFEPVTDMTGGGPFNMKPGEWTDDTSMALCMAQSLITCKGFDAKDQMDKYVAWWDFGYMSPKGYCFDIGGTTKFGLHTYKQTGEPFSGSTHNDASGNGSLMRLVPAVLAAYPDIDKIHTYAKDSSRTTHGSPEAVECCVLFADILASVLDGLPKNELLASVMFQPEQLKVIGIAAGEFLEKTRDQIEGSGYCVESLEAALWCFFKTDSFDDAVLMAVNLGRDADTTAAIAGQIAGAFYGVNGIRKNWLDKLYMGSEIKKMADDLYELANN